MGQSPICQIIWKKLEHFTMVYITSLSFIVIIIIYVFLRVFNCIAGCGSTPRIWL